MAQTYYSQILAWDWAGIKKDAEESTEPGGEPCRANFLGTVMSLTPSGKYYMPWACSNVTEREARKDEAWWAALERAAEKHGGYVASGEGDPCDIFVFFPSELEPEEDEDPDA